MAGYWGYTGKFMTQNDFNADGSQHEVYGSDGGYIGGATRLYTIEGKRGLDGFANLGFADPVVNQTDRSLNAGLTLTGPFEDRSFDKFGVAVGIAGDSEPYKKAQIAAGNGVHNYETNFEMTYRAPITDWLTIQPDIQYWIHPNYDPALQNDLLVGVHFEIGHVFDL
jgi:porin